MPTSTEHVRHRIILAIRAAAEPRHVARAQPGLDREEHERLEGRAVHAALLVQPVVYN